jgi:hypothetical protein
MGSLKWACDVAAFIGSHSKLDWIADLSPENFSRFG